MVKNNNINILNIKRFVKKYKDTLARNIIFVNTRLYKKHTLDILRPYKHELTKILK